ncbi:hypothetical protein IMSAG025_00938 [Muribaculaceae bacterium]|nr:hypothetical protein IMSAG025_00938 [Muribaculaceae bacterium]
MEIEIGKKFAAYSLAGTLEKNIVGQHDSGTAAIAKRHHDMLQEVELIVLCLCDKVIALNVNRTCRTCAERRICEYDIKKFLRLFLQ